MTTVKFTLANGEAMTVEGRVGESIMRAATRNSVPGIEGECGGEMSCATCHVYVRSPWKEQLRRPSPDEQDLLAVDDACTEDSRLGCQVKLTEELDGIEVTVAHEA